VSAVFELDLAFSGRPSTKINIKGGGQECPPHTCTQSLRASERLASAYE